MGLLVGPLSTNASDVFVVKSLVWVGPVCGGDVATGAEGESVGKEAAGGLVTTAGGVTSASKLSGGSGVRVKVGSRVSMTIRCEVGPEPGLIAAQAKVINPKTITTFVWRERCRFQTSFEVWSSRTIRFDTSLCWGIVRLVCKMVGICMAKPDLKIAGLGNDRPYHSTVLHLPET